MTGEILQRCGNWPGDSKKKPTVFPRPYNHELPIDPAVNAIFNGTHVKLGKEGKPLYEQSGYGRLEPDGIRLSPQEALYLLHRQKIEVDGYSFDALFTEFADQRNFLRSFLVYRDLKNEDMSYRLGPMISGYSGEEKNRGQGSLCTLSASFPNAIRSGSQS